MLQLNTLIEQSSPQVVEQQLIKQYLVFAKQNGVSQYTAHQSLVWVLKLMRFHNDAHPADLNQHDIESYLSALAIEQHVSKSTQQLALSAISAFYREFINTDLHLERFVKSKTRRGFSDRFSASACQSIIQNLKGPSQLMAKLAYQCQLRLSQVASLKISDLDLKSGTLSIYDKNNQLKFKVTIPLSLQLDLRIQRMRASQINNQLKRQMKQQYLLANNKGKPTQIGLFKTYNSLLFILSDIKSTSDLQQQHQINPDSQLAILKSEIRIILNRNKLSSLSKLPTNPNDKVAATTQKKPTLFKLAKNMTATNQPLKTKVAVSSIPSSTLKTKRQKDFFDLGAA